MRARAAVLREFYEPFELIDIELDSPAAGQLIIRTEAAPFCSTDWMGWQGMRRKRPPVVLGHTAVGTVVKLGAGVTNVQVGDRVVVSGTPECGECFYCQIERSDQCVLLMEGGDPERATAPDGARVGAAGRVGAYASHILIESVQVHPLPESLSVAQASLLGCGISTAFGAVETIAQVQPGQSVAVIGLGHLGLWAVQAAKLAGASLVIGIDGHGERRELARLMGATDTIDANRQDSVESVQRLTEGRGADVVIEAAGPATTTRQAVLMARRGGTIVCTGVAHSDTEVAIPQLHLTVFGKTIHGCQNGEMTLSRDMPRWIDLLARGVISTEHILTREYDLTDIDTVLHRSMLLEDVSGVFVGFSDSRDVHSV